MNDVFDIAYVSILTMSITFLILGLVFSLCFIALWVLDAGSLISLAVLAGLSLLASTLIFFFGVSLTLL